MNKSELIAAMALKAGLTKVQAKNALEALLDTSKDALKKGEKIALIGFGTFEAKERKARTSRNPRTGEAVQVAASTAPAFKAGKEFKDKVNK